MDFSTISKSSWKYTLIDWRERAEELKTSRSRSHYKSWGRRTPSKEHLKYFVFIFIFVCLAVLGILALSPNQQIKIPHVQQHSQTCRTRKEWRSLSALNQQEYITAVQCLMNITSNVEAGTSLYDDFAYTHTNEGVKSHYTASFPAWHRYFIHLYEQALVNECGFQGTLPYWDWSIDSKDIRASPVWDAQRGFGGDGEHLGNITVSHGRCVMDGPFANTTRHWQSKKIGDDYYTIVNPHCFSRGFITQEPRLHSLLRGISPHNIQDLLDEGNYREFFQRLELSIHNSIPLIINGDFASLTAPNDPVFFLHHTQVDRLWWIWQQKNPSIRWHEFNGPTVNFKHNNSGEASLDDTLHMGGLGKRIQVRDVMRTDTAFLCYQY